MNTPLKVLITVLFLSLLVTSAQAQWTEVVPGIDYREWDLSSPDSNVFVARMDISNTDCFIESSIGQGKLNGGTETVRSQANRYEDSINYWDQTWGNRTDVVVAINGDFYTSGVPHGGQIHSSWYDKRYTEFGGSSGFVWNLNRVAFMGQCVSHISNKQKVGYPRTGQDQNFQNINTARGSDELIIYTPQFDVDTGTSDDSGSVEVVVEMSKPCLIMPLTNYVSGTVVEINLDSGSTVIPFDCVVLSATGSAATKVISNVQMGDEIHISQEVRPLIHDCSTSLAGVDWTKAYAGIGGNFMFLENGTIRSTTNVGLINHDPRTAIAMNDDYVFYIVVDGRSGISVGMNMTELANFCLAELSATYGINQDGGGSSTMWVDGVVKNDPSDGSERWVANGMMMAVVRPKMVSGTFIAAPSVQTNTSTAVRTGPGDNYPLLYTAPSGQTGTIVGHQLNGVFAKGSYWWKWEYGGNVGWTAEEDFIGGTPVHRWEDIK